MPSHRMGRTTEDILRELTAIFRELKDPRVQGLISIVRVEVTNDLSYATVYVSSLQGMDAAKAAVKGLTSAAGYMRTSESLSKSTSPVSASMSTAVCA